MACPAMLGLYAITGIAPRPGSIWDVSMACAAGSLKTRPDGLKQQLASAALRQELSPRRPKWPLGQKPAMALTKGHPSQIWQRASPAQSGRFSHS